LSSEHERKRRQTGDQQRERSGESERGARHDSLLRCEESNG
jgi:hypothetical protein